MYYVVPRPSAFYAITLQIPLFQTSVILNIKLNLLFAYTWYCRAYVKIFILAERAKLYMSTGYISQFIYLFSLYIYIAISKVLLDGRIDWFQQMLHGFNDHAGVSQPVNIYITLLYPPKILHHNLSKKVLMQFLWIIRLFKNHIVSKFIFVVQISTTMW